MCMINKLNEIGFKQPQQTTTKALWLIVLHFKQRWKKLKPDCARFSSLCPLLYSYTDSKGTALV